MKIDTKNQKPNPDYIRELKNLVKDSPFPRHLSFHLTEISFDFATVELMIANHHLQPFGIVHGGVISTLIDTATFWAAFLRLPEEAGLVNIDLKLNYLKQVRSGLLTAHGKCIRSGRTISYAEANVEDAEGNLIAHGTSTLMALPGEGIPMNSKKFMA